MSRDPGGASADWKPADPRSSRPLHARPVRLRTRPHRLRIRQRDRMSYQVLARKWRPRTFAELSGQEHVVTALTNALDARTPAPRLPADRHARRRQDDDRAHPRQEPQLRHRRHRRRPAACARACVDIDAGRFVDLLELDAASNTGIDNMREILDNARYAPTVGRYKVYLIDEVHMLSKAAFNSMLKTLEEPPEHVKFVLATTDPQKIPVTVLSRCLQFNLKPLCRRRDRRAPRVHPARGGHRARRRRAGADRARRAGLAARRAVAARPGDRLRRRRGAGARRCARCSASSTATYVYRIADALAATTARRCSPKPTRSRRARPVADVRWTSWRRCSIASPSRRRCPQATEAFDDAERIAGYAARLSPEAVQLAYQISAQGRADLALAPDEATGLR